MRYVNALVAAEDGKIAWVGRGIDNENIFKNRYGCVHVACHLKPYDALALKTLVQLA
jgi:hypothetical protein